MRRIFLYRTRFGRFLFSVSQSSRTILSVSTVRRSIAQLKELDLSTDVDKDTARKKLDTCLENLEELRRTVETLKMVLDD